MDFVSLSIGILIGLLGGGVVVFLMMKGKASKELELLRTESDELKRASISAEEQKNSAERLLADRDGEIDRLRKEIKTLTDELGEWKSKAQIFEGKLEDHKEEVEGLQEKFTKEFKLVANELLDEKSKAFKEKNKESIGELLNPLNERIKEFQKKVEDSNKEGAERNAALKQQIETLQKANQDITEEAKNLTRALKGDSKLQGNWGEMQLESILEKAGLKKDIHYTKETSLKDDEGSNQRLDFIIKLPDDKHLILDSKVSLTAYANFYDADEEADQEKHLKLHMDSLYGHIKSLGEKNYQKLYGINPPDYVLMFVANEPALTLALQNDHGLFEKALDKNLVLVSTSTLLATLRTISYIWKQDLQNKNAEEIARQAAGLYEKFANFSDDLVRLGNQLGTVNKTYNESMKKLSEGKDNLVRKTERLKQLGVNPSKKIDQRLLDRSEEE